MSAIATTRDRIQHRVRIEDSPRRVRVFVDHVAIADSRRVKLLFETGHLPEYYFPRPDVRQDLLVPTSHTTHCPYRGNARYYIHPLDMRRDLLQPSQARTRCPYKGIASCWSVTADGTMLTDVAWSYQAPIAESAKIARLACFYNENVDVIVDGELQDRPTTRWSM
jgi:uncharacterized protein (DUF427 family)